MARPFTNAGRGARSSALSGINLDLGVMGGAEEVDDDDWIVTEDVGVVTGGEAGDVAGARIDLTAFRRDDAKRAGDVVLEVGRLAQLRAGERLHRLRPAPA